MNELVARLTTGVHSIVAERSESPEELLAQIDRGFVLLKFPDTRGGTELGSQLDMQQTRIDGADFENGTGQVHLVGNLTLNYDKVQLVADIDLESLTGSGHLVLIEEEIKSDAPGEAAANGVGSGRASNGSGDSGVEVSVAQDTGDTENVAETKTKERARKKATGKRAAANRKKTTSK